jgi:hypothetical protein
VGARDKGTAYFFVVAFLLSSSEHCLSLDKARQYCVLAGIASPASLDILARTANLFQFCPIPRCIGHLRRDSERWLWFSLPRAFVVLGREMGLNSALLMPLDVGASC